MACDNLRPANFMRCIAGANFSATELKTVDQCAMSILQERRDERRMHALGMRKMFSNPTGYKSMEQYEHDARVMNAFSKRLDRGGMTRRPEDGVMNAPRTRTFRDMDL